MRRAFTIVELLVAIALATTIIFTAFTAFRVAQTAIGVGNRLASENSLLRAGYAFGMREIDGWEGTRAATAALTPNPFAVLNASTLNTIDHRPTEDWWHWREAITAMPAALPATGWHNSTFAMPGLTATESADLYKECRYFYSNSLIRETTLDTLGWYGYLSYMPYGTLYTSKRGWSGDNNVWGGVNFGDAATSTGGWVTDWFNTTMYSPTLGGGRSRGGIAYAFGAQTVLYGLTASTAANEAVRTNLLAASIRPAHWPDLQVNVSRSYSFGRITHYVEINAKSPVTDQLLSLHFRTWGTTLRGARINANIGGEAALSLY